MVTTPNLFEQILAKKSTALAKKIYEKRTGETLPVTPAQPSTPRPPHGTTPPRSTVSRSTPPNLTQPSPEPELTSVKEDGANVLQQAYEQGVRPGVLSDSPINKMIPNTTIKPDTTRFEYASSSKVRKQIVEPSSYQPDYFEAEKQKSHIIGRDISDEPVYAKKSPYLIDFGFKPSDPDYGNVLSGLKKRESEFELMQKEHSDMLGFISGQSPGTVFVDKETGRFVGTRESLLVMDRLTSPQSKIQSGLDEISRQKNLVEGYQSFGYEMDVTDEGYSFTFPLASTVHKSMYGESSDIGLISASFMESPLAVKTFASALYAIGTGDKEVTKTRREDLAGFALGLTKGIETGDYVEQVAFSPAMIEGVYVPLATFGLGYGIAAGGRAAGGLLAPIVSNISSKSTTLSLIGSEIISGGSRIVSSRAGQALLISGLYAGTEGRRMVDIFQSDPGRVPGEFGESLFSFGLSLAAFKAGSEFHSAMQVEGRTPDVLGRMDIFETQTSSDKAFFEGFGKQKIAGGKPSKLEVYGISDKVDDMWIGKDLYYTRGAGKITRSIGRGRENISFFKFEGIGTKLGEIDDLNIFGSVSESSSLLKNLYSGSGKGLSFIKTKGKIVPGEWSGYTLPAESFVPEESIYTYFGKYGKDYAGSQFQAGRVFSFKPYADVVGGEMSAGGTVLKIDYGRIFSAVSKKTVEHWSPQLANKLLLGSGLDIPQQGFIKNVSGNVALVPLLKSKHTKNSFVGFESKGSINVLDVKHVVGVIPGHDLSSKQKQRYDVGFVVNVGSTGQKQSPKNDTGFDVGFGMNFDVLSDVDQGMKQESKSARVLDVVSGNVLSLQSITVHERVSSPKYSIPVIPLIQIGGESVVFDNDFFIPLSGKRKRKDRKRTHPVDFLREIGL